MQKNPWGLWDLATSLPNWKKGNQTTSYWSISKGNYELKDHFQSWHKKERTDLSHAISNVHQKTHTGCHKQPEPAQFTPLRLVIQANADCSSTARALSKKGWVTGLSYVSYYAQTCLVRKEGTFMTINSQPIWNTGFVWPSQNLEMKE